ncbi:hypothetical protein DPMN_095316 [Dreissena polymorpha]|uniref:Uncharacterized protein n=1 Tax=Dreissena polymorpha TaxID=45954 RepID=A0A9D4R2M0_DREPO|nr:hypothetical protein DPMN_095316 [Dreissena polymorpha]
MRSRQRSTRPWLKNWPPSPKHRIGSGHGPKVAPLMRSEVVQGHPLMGPQCPTHPSLRPAPGPAL